MPTMLGLTTDESPHGLNSKSGSLTAEGQAKGHGSITGSATRNGRDFDYDDYNSGNGDQQMQPYHQSQQQQQQQQQLQRHQNHQQSSKSKPLNNRDSDAPKKVDKDGNKKRLNTIGARNHAAARTMDTLFWRAMCDDPTDALDYMAPDVAVVAPLLFGTQAALRREATDENPGLEEALGECEVVKGFRIDEIRTIESALMAVGSVARITLGLGGEEVQAVCSSSWRQDAGADWFLCGMLVAKAD